MNIIFKSNTNLVMGDFDRIIAAFEDSEEEYNECDDINKVLVVSFIDKDNDDNCVDVRLEYRNITKQKMSKILDKIYKDISQNSGVCILEEELFE